MNSTPSNDVELRWQGWGGLINDLNFKLEGKLSNIIVNSGTVVARISLLSLVKSLKQRKWKSNIQ